MLMENRLAAGLPLSPFFFRRMVNAEGPLGTWKAIAPNPSISTGAATLRRTPPTPGRPPDLPPPILLMWHFFPLRSQMHILSLLHSDFTSCLQPVSVPCTRATNAARAANKNIVIDKTKRRDNVRK